MPTEREAGDQDTPNAGLDPERQRQAREYARRNRRLLLVELLLSGLAVVLFLVTGLSAWLRDLLLAVGIVSPWALVPACLALVYVGYEVLFLPLSWYGGYTLPHRYGLSTQRPRGWALDELKSLGLGLIFVIAIGQAVYWLLRTYPVTWWLWAAALLLTVNLLLGFVAPVLIVPLFYKLTPLDDAGLVERIRRLAERTGRRIADVYTIDLSSRTTAANAVFLGLGRTQRIALGDTLYRDYSPDEIEGIVAHELGHQVHGDLWLGLLLQGAVLVGALAAAQALLRWGVAVFGFAGPGDVAALPLLVLAAGLVSLVALPLTNGFSRWREHMADRFAVQATGNPVAFGQALTRLANQNLAEADPPRWVVWLLYSHPPMGQRIAETRVYSPPRTC